MAKLMLEFTARTHKGQSQTHFTFREAEASLEEILQFMYKWVPTKILFSKEELRDVNFRIAADDYEIYNNQIEIDFLIFEIKEK